MPDSMHDAIFRRGSRTYFTSSRFFPRAFREEVAVLYGFVRTADDFVDSVPPDTQGFLRFRLDYSRGLEEEQSGVPVIDAFLQLGRRKGFKPEWTEAFLDSMQWDLGEAVCRTVRETERYIHGSAEVIGFMMAALMNLPDVAFPYAGELGRAMQYINFIRDIREDLELGRCYLPLNEIHASGLKSLEEGEARAKPQRFEAFIRGQLRRYRKWQAEAEKGFRFLPRAFLIPVKTASDMYGWTARRIEKQPLVVFRKKVKPARMRILGAAVMNTTFLRST